MHARNSAAAVLLALATSGCYRGAGAAADASTIARDPGWIRVDVPFVRQDGPSDCGAAALASVLAYWGRSTPLASIERAVGGTGDDGASAGELQREARREGLSAFVFFANVDDLRHELERGRPVIVGVVKPYAPGRGLTHYQVVVGYEPERERLLTLDPADGLRDYPLAGFLREWEPTKRVAMVVFELPA